mgnify:CR=1 FL=1
MECPLAAYYAPYLAGTCHDLLKWKFPSMNSVDFQLRIQPGGEPKLLLLHPRGKHRDYELKELEGAAECWKCIWLGSATCLAHACARSHHGRVYVAHTGLTPRPREAA